MTSVKLNFSFNLRLPHTQREDQPHGFYFERTFLFFLLSSRGELLLFFSPFKSTASCFLSISGRSLSRRRPAGASPPSADQVPASSEG